MMITEDMLRNAAAEVREAMLASLPEQETMHHMFSRRFERKMSRLIRRQKGEHQVLRRIAAVFLALLLGGGIWLTVDADASAAFRKWLQSVYENSIVYRFFNDTGETLSPGQYRLRWVPEGYSENNIVAFDSCILITYSNMEEENLYLYYTRLNDWVQIEATLDEMMEPVEVTVDGMRGIFYQSKSPTRFNELFWFDDEHNVAFQLSSSLEEIVMLHIAENVYLVNSTN